MPIPPSWLDLTNCKSAPHSGIRRQWAERGRHSEQLGTPCGRYMGRCTLGYITADETWTSVLGHFFGPLKLLPQASSVFCLTLPAEFRRQCETMRDEVCGRSFYRAEMSPDRIFRFIRGSSTPAQMGQESRPQGCPIVCGSTVRSTFAIRDSGGPFSLGNPGSG